MIPAQAKRLVSGRFFRDASRIRTAPAILRFLQPLLLSGCSAAPSQNILGSFFPSWMLCAGIGVVGAVIIRRIVSRMGLDGAILAPPLTYVAIAVAITLLVWLTRFGG